MTLQTDEEIRARLLATLPSDHTAWSGNTTLNIVKMQSKHFFFTLALTGLATRAKAIADVATRKNLTTVVGRNPLADMIGGQATSLDHMIQAHRMLREIAASDDDELKRLTLLTGAAEPHCIQLEENAVIPSLFWVNRHMLAEFISEFKITRETFGIIAFGESRYSEDIILKLINSLGSPDKTQKQYRVTPFTADAIYTAVRALYQLRGVHRINEASQFAVLPRQTKFFDDRYTAGTDAGNRGKQVALRIDDGNLTEALSAVDQEGIVSRAAQFVTDHTGRPVSPAEERRVRNLLITSAPVAVRAV